MSRTRTLLQKAVDVRPNELRALLLACGFHFVILASYYVVRPIRDDIGAVAGVEKLPWMYSGTLVAMLFANAAFSAIVARMSRRKFLPIAYRFFIGNLLIFYVLMRTLSPAENVWVGRAFFVWVSVFNLFVVSLFWAFMSDIFDSEQAKRLFAFIAVGGELGAIAGPIVTASLVRRLGAPNLLLVTAALLEIAPWCVKFFPAVEHSPTSDRDRTQVTVERVNGIEQKREQDDEGEQKNKDARGAEQPVGGGILAGISHVFRSPYLLGICAFLLLHAISNTIVYFQQADLTGHHFHDRAARMAFFAQLDLSVNTLTILGQLLLTGRLLKWFGVGFTLAFLPVLSVIGFLGMGFVPMLGLLAVYQVLRRAGNFAVTRPAREVLFTVLRREDKYKAKSFIDTFVYRAGDQIGAWSYPLLTWFGLGLRGISFVAAPLAAVWCVLSIWLGRRQAEMARGAQ
ncbi:MAG TPA: MFS transporter [Chthoniobacterales bacterium]|jgi:AAA family ATP:ADP antiporter